MKKILTDIRSFLRRAKLSMISGYNMAAGRIHVCAVCFSVALLFLAFYAELIIVKSMEKDVAFARRPVFAAW